MLGFSLPDIQKMADGATFQRGFEHFKAGRVEMHDYDVETGVYTANVRGVGRNIYEVAVLMTSNGLVTQCNCPAELNCEHGVAAAIHWLKIKPSLVGDSEPSTPRRQAVDNSSWEDWLAQLPPSEQPDTTEFVSGRHYLLYLLGKSISGEYTLELRKAYLRKDGHWSQLSLYRPDFHGLKYNWPAFMLANDAQILRLLSGLRSSFDGYRLERESGAFILDLLLRTRRLYWEEGEQALTALPAEKLTWAWNETEQGQQLTAQIEGVSRWQLLSLKPPHYLDLNRHGVGELITDIPSEQLDHLLQMPPIPPGQMLPFGAQLRQFMTSKQLPLPEEPELALFDTPVPHLRVLVAQMDNGVHLPGVQVSFDYGGYRAEVDLEARISALPELIERNGQSWLVKRDIEAEEAALHRLHAMGLGLVERLGSRSNVWVPRDHRGSDMLQQWQRFMQQRLPELQAEGWQVEIDADYELPVHNAAFDLKLRDGANNWFDFSLQLPTGNNMFLPTQSVVAEWLEQDCPDEICLPVEDGWVRIDTQPLQPIYSLIIELYSQQKLDKPVSLPPYKAAQLGDTIDFDQRLAPLTSKMMRELNNFAGIEPLPLPRGVKAQLRSYQQQGLDWLGFLQRYGFGGILADDMGLGKTLQTLSLVQWLKNNKRLHKRPVLVVAPTSLMGNWEREAAQFTPELKACLIHGPDRARQFDRIAKSDLVITSYQLLLRDADRYKKRKFSLLVLDEAQAIKNPNTKIAQQVRRLDAASRLCLTGTPLENHLGELWALMDFALPGLLGGLKAFNQHYRQPIEQEGDQACQRRLAQLVSPFMLRRTKSDVVQELLPKTEMTQYVELEGRQRELYESIRISMEQRIRALVAEKGLARSQIEFLDALLKLRQACIDPRLVKLEKAAGIKEGAKLGWLRDNLPELLAEGRRMLIFSQFTAVLGLVELLLKDLKVGYSKLTGQTRKRQEMIDRFQSEEVPVFLISLKAGGSGLNLTAADTVIHLDPWWNPAVEQQATDRAYRIGQDKPVFVYKLVAADTVEERIQLMQQEKQALADALFDEAGRSGMPQDKETLLALLA
jgi:superfamily II DNA or RNA helicase